MKYLKIFGVLVFSIFFNCDDNERNIEATLSASNFMTIINENPSLNEVLGTISATTSQGELFFRMIEQNPTGGMRIHSSTGEIIVHEPALFDFETNPMLTALVEISNGEATETVTVTIQLIDVDENAVTAFDLDIILYEMPIINQYLGLVEAYADEGNISFSILEQSPIGVLEIDSITGELTIIEDFQFAGNEIIVATIRVQHQDIPSAFQDITVTVHLTHECDTENILTLLAHYPFNGNPLDETDYDNHGTVNGPILISDRFSQNDSAYYFDGIDDVISVPDNEQLYLGDEFTISAWIYPEEIKTQQIIRKGTAVSGVEAHPYGLALSNSNDFVFSITANGTLFQARQHGYNIYEWYLVTGILKDQKMYLYVNGELVSYEQIDGTIYDDSLPLLIGTRLSLPSSTFKGIIDDVRIYNKAICEEDIIHQFNN